MAKSRKYRVIHPLIGGLALFNAHHALAQTSTPSDKGADQGSKSSSDAIVVTGKAPQEANKIDRRIYDVKSDPEAGTAMLNDILGKLPSVNVSPRGEITLRGSTQVTVLIDGKPPISQSLVRNMPASEVDHIEVITNPSAQFSSEGAAGIINIITKKKHKQGLTGTINLRLSDRGAGSTSTSLTYQHDDWSFTGGVYLARNKAKSDSNSDLSWRDSAASPVQSLQQFGYNAFSFVNEGIVLGTSYSPSDTDKFSLKSSFDTNIRNGTRPFISYAYDNNRLSGVYDQNNTEKYVDFDSNFDANYDHKGHSGDSLKIDLNHAYVKSRDLNDIDLNYSVPTTLNQIYLLNTVGTKQDTDLKVDYDLPLADKRHFTTGLDIDGIISTTSHMSDGLADLAVGSIDENNLFSYNQTKSAFYLTYQTSMGKWEVMPGLRVENTDRTVNDVSANVAVSKSYARWMPTLHIQTHLGDNLVFKSSYSRRTQSPTSDQLNPSVYYQSLTYASMGNPNLMPQDTDSFETGYEYTRKGFSSIGTLYYRANYNLITSYASLINNVTTLNSYTNASSNHIGGAEYSTKGDVSKTLSYSLNVNLNHNELQGDAGGVFVNKSYDSYSGNGTLDFKPDADDKYQLNTQFQGKTSVLSGSSTGYTLLGLVYLHQFNKRLSFNISANDMLKSYKQKIYIQSPMLNSETDFRVLLTHISMGLVYKLDAK